MPIKVSAGIRIKSMLLDHIIMTLIAIAFFIPLLLNQITNPQLISHEQKNLGYFFGTSLYFGLLGVALYFCKDCVNGQSFAKRRLKLQVVDNKTAERASAIKCFVRNIFCIIWPIEIIAVIITPEKRIGDRVAGTRVIYCDQPLNEPFKPNIKKLAIPIILSYLLTLLLIIPLQSLKLPPPKLKYVVSSYNENESKALEKLYKDSLGKDLDAEVRIYDTMLNHRYKYVDIIFRLKKNYLADFDSMMPFKALTKHYLYSMFPEITISGEAEYVYGAEKNGLLYKSASLSTSIDKIGVVIIEDSDK